LFNLIYPHLAAQRHIYNWYIWWRRISL